jgi:hypothetical protein
MLVRLRSEMMDVARLRKVRIDWNDGEVYEFHRERLTDLWEGEGIAWSNEFFELYLTGVEKPYGIIRGYE